MLSHIVVNTFGGLVGRLRDRKGQSIVEISLITPLVLIALYIPIDFALMFQAAHRVQNAVRETARIASATNPFDQTNMQSDLDARLADASGFTVTSRSVTLLKTGSASCTHVVTATAQIDYPFFFYRMMNWFGANIQSTRPVTRTARMRYEFQPVTNGGVPCTAA